MAIKFNLVEKPQPGVAGGGVKNGMQPQKPMAKLALMN